MKLTTSQIIEDLPYTEAARSHSITLHEVHAETQTLVLRVGSLEDLDIFVTVGERQIVVSTAIAPVAEIPEQPDFNVMLLKSQGMLPLSSFAIQTVGGVDQYEIHGEMSLESSVPNLMEEIVTTAQNAILAAELVEEWKNAKAGS